MRLFRRDFGEARVPQVARVAQALRERLARRSKPDRREN
jgi:hypothetical protein